MKLDLDSPATNRLLGIALLVVSGVGLNIARQHHAQQQLLLDQQALRRETVPIPPYKSLGKTPSEWAETFNTAVGEVLFHPRNPHCVVQKGDFKLHRKDGVVSKQPFSYVIAPDGTMMNTIMVGKVAIALEYTDVLCAILETSKQEKMGYEPKFAIFPDLSYTSCLFLLGPKDSEHSTKTEYRLFQSTTTQDAPVVSSAFEVRKAPTTTTIASVSVFDLFVQGVVAFTDEGSNKAKFYELVAEQDQEGEKQKIVLRVPYHLEDCRLKPHITSIEAGIRRTQYVAPLGDCLSFREACSLRVNAWPQIQHSMMTFPSPETRLHGKEAFFPDSWQIK